MVITSLPKTVNASEIAPDRLADNPALSERQKIGEASRQFEAILLRQILDSTQKPVIHSKFTDNSTAAGIYRDMITNQLADSISKSGTLGLAKTFESQLERPATDVKKPASHRVDAVPTKLSSTGKASSRGVAFHPGQVSAPPAILSKPIQ
jgi:Rod binding domain-containing protein